ncbi:hypothetical protein ABKN59_011326 [Abortiporus biennis]
MSGRNYWFRFHHLGLLSTFCGRKSSFRILKTYVNVSRHYSPEVETELAYRSGIQESSWKSMSRSSWCKPVLWCLLCRHVPWASTMSNDFIDENLF